MRTLVGFWRRSIQTRVVTSTILLSALAITLTGWALLHDVAHGLADDRKTTALAQARAGLEQAQEKIDAAVESGQSTQSETLTNMIDSLTSTKGTSRTYELVLEGPLDRAGNEVPVRSSAALAPDSIPADLTKKVEANTGAFWRYSSLHLVGNSERSAGVVIGSQLQVPSTGDTYAMYYLFSMADQQSTLTLVRQALLLGGLAMVLMVGGVAWLVSRQVLNPVRLARGIAERYAAGSLDQRMHVSGEDDIARLSTSFNQMAASLQHQIRRLENLSLLQQRFVSDVSHELRTPLTTVRMAGTMLHESRHTFDPQTARATELLNNELDRFEALLSDLLDLSRFDAGAAQLELAPVDLAEVARESVNHALLASKNIDVVVINADRPAVVDADVRRVDRIVRNLLTNAAKYGGGDHVEIEVRQNENCVSLAVRDFGVGLSGDENLRVFDRFWRADPARAQGGTGLGLPISREDAELHGGTLKAWGRSGEGSEFILTLPKNGEQPVPAAIVSVFE